MYKKNKTSRHSLAYVNINVMTGINNNAKIIDFNNNSLFSGVIGIY